MLQKADLFAPRLPEEEVETVVGTIKVRGLSRAEVLSLGKLAEDSDAWDERMLSLGVVDPALSPAEVRKWRKAWRMDDFKPVVETIERLSAVGGSEISSDDFPASS